IQTMALVHEKLYRSANFSRVDFGEYARSLSALLAGTYSARSARVALNTQIEDVSLGVDVALPLGLIINELISNSLKYAFPDGGEGEIRIAIDRLGDDQLQLVVADNGVGFPADIDFRDTETLGMKLVVALAGQIGASIELHSGTGAEFRISFSPKP